jgi:cytoskeletal protein CcmA (bactofilin family)
MVDLFWPIMREAPERHNRMAPDGVHTATMDPLCRLTGAYFRNNQPTGISSLWKHQARQPPQEETKMFDRNKKGASEVPPASSQQPPAGSPVDARPAATAASASTPARRRETAVIGASIQIDGHLRGQEDLIIEGEVNGTVNLASNTLTIGNQAKIKANVFAHTVYVDGTMDGDLYGAEQVLIRKTARMKGNITSPRVSLEDGASFKGSIEMDPEAVKAAIGGVSSTPRNTATVAAVQSAPAQPTAAQSKAG